MGGARSRPSSGISSDPSVTYSPSATPLDRLVDLCHPRRRSRTAENDPRSRRWLFCGPNRDRVSGSIVFSGRLEVGEGGDALAVWQEQRETTVGAIHSASSKSWGRPEPIASEGTLTVAVAYHPTESGRTPRDLRSAAPVLALWSGTSTSLVATAYTQRFVRPARAGGVRLSNSILVTAGGYRRSGSILEAMHLPCGNATDPTDLQGPSSQATWSTRAR